MTWVFVAWAASFLTCYMVSLRPLSRDDELSNYWRGNFSPHALSLIVPWLSYNFFAAFKNPAPLNSILGAAFFVAGCGQLLRRSRLRFGLLTAPLLALFLASLLHRYPLYGRLLLFLCPILLLSLPKAQSGYTSGIAFSPTLGVAVIALLLANPLYLAADTLIRPFGRTTSRPESFTSNRINGPEIAVMSITEGSINSLLCRDLQLANGERTHRLRLRNG